MAVNKWTEEAHVRRYLGHAGTLPHRAEGEAVLRELLPASVGRVLDLGTGDGRVLGAVLAARPGATAGVGTDFSPPMLAAVRARFAGDPRVAVVCQNMDAPLPGADLLAAADAAEAAAAAVAAVGVTGAASSARPTGGAAGNDGGSGDGSAAGTRRFDVIVSAFAIHHLSDARKAAIYAEAADLLAPGGVLINMDLVASPTAALQAEFLEALGMEEDDPSDQLAPVAPQLTMLRDAGLTDVECFWKWRQMAILAGRKPAAGGA